MKRRTFMLLGLAPLAMAACRGDEEPTPAEPTPPEPTPTDDRASRARDAMKRAAVYMDERVSYRGGYVWAYLADLSKSWGEMEAKRTMCWIQPPGTPSAAHSFLDAYHATGDEAFYRAAERSCLALIEAQHPAGGWNYIYDFAGEESLKHWYETIGINGWRLEEFQHYYGNATFDDAGTAVASQVLLRMYLEKRDPRFLEPLNKAISFVLDAQYKGGVADGGWPQRYPPAPNAISSMPRPNPEQLPSGASQGMADGDYTRHVTFNDDVAGENIKFLLMCVIGLGETRLIEPVMRAMEALRRLQQPAPQAGWGLQHLSADQDGRPAGAPAGARSYEPRALATHTTQTNIQQLFHYFRLTGDRKYLERVPEAIAWLESTRLTEQMIAENPLLKGRTHPTFIELGTNRPLFVHRYGSNIWNGAYYVDHDHHDTPSHYSAGRSINIANLRATYDQLSSMSDAAIAEMVAKSPLKTTQPRALPKYFSLREVDFPDLYADAVMTTSAVTDETIDTLIQDLGTKDHWLTPVVRSDPAVAASFVTNPYRGNGPSTPYTGDAYRSKHVGDIYDTSPYDSQDPPATYEKKPRLNGISTADFVSNMGKLIAYVSPLK
ncbi:pectate lyase [Cystobacter fuscus]|uniref:pectate lyase n=1 Tax=Cystobacter fuscus TaxID=43 RepID=UPI0037BE9802